MKQIFPLLLIMSTYMLIGCSKKVDDPFIQTYDNSITLTDNTTSYPYHVRANCAKDGSIMGVLSITDRQKVWVDSNLPRLKLIDSHGAQHIMTTEYSASWFYSGTTKIQQMEFVSAVNPGTVISSIVQY